MVPRYLRTRLLALRLSALQQALVFEDLAVLLRDGSSLPYALQLIAAEVEGPVASMLQAAVQGLSKGQSLAESLQGWLAPATLALLSAGQAAGTLPKALLDASYALRQQHQFTRRLARILSYPMVLYALGGIVTIFLSHAVFQPFTSLVPLTLWPGYAIFLQRLAFFFERTWALCLMILSTSSVLLVWLCRCYIGEWRQWFDTLPILSHYREMTAASLLRNLSLLLANGMIMKQAFAAMKRQGNPYLSQHVQFMEYHLSAGKARLGDVLNTGLLNKREISRLNLLAASTGIDEQLRHLSEYAQERALLNAERDARRLSGLLLIVVVGLVILMIFSLYDVGNVLRFSIL